MKTTLTIEQSAELIKRGVTLNENDSEVFDIGELLSLLPKKITFGHRTNCRLKMQPIISSKDCISEVWQACYLHTSLKANAEATELIDALYELLLFVLENYPNEQTKITSK